MIFKNKKGSSVLAIAILILSVIAIFLALITSTISLDKKIDGTFVGPGVVETASSIISEVRFDEYALENKSFYKNYDEKLTSSHVVSQYGEFGQTFVSFRKDGRKLIVYYQKKDLSPILVNVTYMFD